MYAADDLRRRRRETEAHLRAAGAQILNIEEINDYTISANLAYDGDLKHLADYIEAVRGVEVLSLGHALEIVKDLGDAAKVGGEYKLDNYFGSHGIGHVRMATESDVDISNAHPYWAYPFSDVAVVHNGQLTNYHTWRRRLESMGHRFASECDSEIIAVYIAQKLQDGDSLKDAMRQALTTSTAYSRTSASARTRSGWPRTSSPQSRSSSTRARHGRVASEEMAIRGSSTTRSTRTTLMRAR